MKKRRVPPPPPPSFLDDIRSWQWVAIVAFLVFLTCGTGWWLYGHQRLEDLKPYAAFGAWARFQEESIFVQHKLGKKAMARIEALKHGGWEPLISDYEKQEAFFRYTLSRKDLRLKQVRLRGMGQDLEGDCKSFEHPAAFDSSEFFPQSIPLNIHGFNPLSAESMGEPTILKLGRDQTVIISGKVFFDDHTIRVSDAEMTGGFPLFFSKSGITSFHVNDFSLLEVKKLGLSKRLEVEPFAFLQKLPLPDWVKDQAIFMSKLEMSGTASMRLDTPKPQFDLVDAGFKVGHEESNLNFHWEGTRLQLEGQEVRVWKRKALGVEFKELVFDADFLTGQLAFDGLLTVNLKEFFLGLAEGLGVDLIGWIEKVEKVPIIRDLVEVLDSILSARTRVAFSLDLEDDVACIKVILSQIPFLHTKVWFKDKKMAIYAPLNIGELTLNPNVSAETSSAWDAFVNDPGSLSNMVNLLPEVEEPGDCHCCLEGLTETDPTQESGKGE
ncbi:MAG: hypothetical protein QNK37_01050 [Acidobacteriota bacterium]|nr:hypothetical protein [Acidobacteriota bacterium]